MDLNKIYDVIVIGAGHAGCEAAYAAARMGCRTILLTQSIETIGQMSCNPSIGGIGKSHLVKEIDALGGAMAHVIDRAGIQFRILNERKGPAVRATRAQADRLLYKKTMRLLLEQQEKLSIFQDTVEDILIKNGMACGVVTQSGLTFQTRTVVLTSGTFLNGQIHVGSNTYPAGRAGDPPSIRLANRLKDLGFPQGRLKTGTPPRINGNTIDYSKLEIQYGDEPTPVFSFLGSRSDHPQQVPCYIAHTNERTHDIIRNNFSRSPLFQGVIKGVGPRYCPSIEDKIKRFAGRESHTIFIEPEGLSTHEIYPNGLSTSLPFDVQVAYVQSMVGFEKAQLVRPGYAIEYDYYDPKGLFPTLETKQAKHLFFAGQINGTTGYEEAAAQGILAGINAALTAQDKEFWYPKREEAYLGVMVDDLVSKGTSEPYRMFTSRAEYRLMLREDNADLRLTPTGWDLGCVGTERWEKFSGIRETFHQEQDRLKKVWVHPNIKNKESVEAALDCSLVHEYSLWDLLKRSDITYQKLKTIAQFECGVMDPRVIEQIEIQAKYAGYIERQGREVARQKSYEEMPIPKSFDYDQVKGLSNEVKQKLLSFAPPTIGIASRIPGVTPASISLVLIYLKRHLKG